MSPFCARVRFTDTGLDSYKIRTGSTKANIKDSSLYECNQNISMRHDLAKIEEKEIAHYIKIKTVQKKKTPKINWLPNWIDAIYMPGLWFTSRRKTNICVCSDFLTGLNECLKIYEYLLPSAKDTFAKLNSSEIFSKLDLSDMYLHIMKKHWSCLQLPHRDLSSFNHLPSR